MAILLQKPSDFGPDLMAWAVAETLVHYERELIEAVIVPYFSREALDAKKRAVRDHAVMLRFEGAEARALMDAGDMRAAIEQAALTRPEFDGAVRG